MTSIDSDDVFEDNTADVIPTTTTTTTTTKPTTTMVDLDNFIWGRPRSRSLYATSRPLVYITRRVPQLGVDMLLGTCNVSQWDSEEAVPRGELLQNVQGAHGVLCMPSDNIDTIVLQAAGPNLRAVATMSEDTRHIDLEECARRNVKVLRCPLPDLADQADLTVALILLTLRTVAEGMDSLTHNISCDQFAATEGKPVDPACAWWNTLIAHKTFGVFGMTSRGLAVAKRLRQMGANDVIVADFGHETRRTLSGSEGEEEGGSDGRENVSTDNTVNMGDFDVVSREKFLERADVVCVCDDARAPSQSDAAFDTEAFRVMKPGAIVVNSDSGHALNYTALYEALRDGQIMGAGLNTCNSTAVPYQYPLQGLKNCVFMPQTHEDRKDLRHKIAVGVTANLLSALQESAPARGV